jgi:hypothetical protein
LRLGSRGSLRRCGCSSHNLCLRRA